MVSAPRSEACGGRGRLKGEGGGLRGKEEVERVRLTGEGDRGHALTLSIDQPINGVGDRGRDEGRAY